MLTSQQIDSLKTIVEELKNDPSLLHDDKLSFFRQYLTSLSAVLPEAPKKSSSSSSSSAESQKSTMEDEAESSSDESAEESEDEVFNETEPKLDSTMNDEDKSMLNEIIKQVSEDDETTAVNSLKQNNIDVELDLSSTEDKEVNDDDEAAAAEAKSKAVEAAENQQYDEALRHYTAAVQKNPKSALTIAARADTLLKLRCPRAAIADCNAALKINPDSVKAMKFRGRAYLQIGQLQEGHRDLSRAQSIDYDDNVASTLHKLQKLFESQRNKERTYKQQMNEYTEKRQAFLRRKRAQEQRREHRRQEKEEKSSGFNPNDFDFSKMGGMPGMGGGMPDFSKMGGKGGGMPDFSKMGGMPDFSKMGQKGGAMPGMPNFGGMPNMGAGKGPNMGSGMGGMPNMPGMGGGMPPMDADMLNALKNPKVMESLQKMMSDPTYRPTDPEVIKILEKMQKFAPKSGQNF